MTDKMRVRQRLLEYLSENNLTIYQFAKKSGIPESTVRGIVQKKITMLGSQIFIKSVKGWEFRPMKYFREKMTKLPFFGKMKFQL